jgi:hypothetical protein
MKIKLLIICIVMISTKSYAVEDLKFIQSLSDVPAFYSMSYDEDTMVEFDSTWGSVIEISGSCKCKCETIENYYDLIMPNLGWIEFPTDNDEKLYIRDSVNLLMDMEEDNYGCVVNFSETH